MIIAALLAVAALPAMAERTHTVVKGDHLWGLAGHYYSNHFRWRVIYAANTDKIKDPHWIYPGQVLVIPDLPGPEVGELGARPVEGPTPVVEPAPEPPREAQPQIVDDLATKLPPGLTGQYPSMERMKVEKSWDEDGRIAEYEGREMMAAQGDVVNGRLKKGSVSVGDKLSVYRRDAPKELEDPKGVYLQRVGRVEVKETKGSEARLLITQSRDAIQVGDLLKRE